MRANKARSAGHWKTIFGVGSLALVVLSLAAAGGAAGQNQGQGSGASGVTRGAPVVPSVFDGDVRDLPSPRVWRKGDPVREIPRRYRPGPGGATLLATRPSADALMEAQQLAGSASLLDPEFTTPSRNFPGQPYAGASPPDTVGDVGPGHYVQMVNSSSGSRVAIYDKAAPTPNQLALFNLDSLGTGACADGWGDPVVVYDRLADRWVLLEFPFSGYHLCVYVSRGSDPVSGGWYAYDFVTPEFPDYPKLGVWPTDRNSGQGSYVVTTNESFPTAYALDRARMLAGTAATYQRATMPYLPGFGFQSVTPADIDGPSAPPAGAAAIVMRHRDTEVHSGPPAAGDLLEMWAWNVDWINAANSTFTQLPSIDVSDFDSTLCGLGFNGCFPQPGSSVTLDPLREVIMNRLQYRNFGDHESLVGNFVIDVGGTDHGGVRWFEARRQGGSWTLQQEGTYAIDASHRWMGSIAMDQSGDIALGYNVVSTTVYPSLRYAGRVAADPTGTMSQPETVIHAGTASSGTLRYGDYAAMSVDPVDDCTFWFTGEDNTASTWRTQIASFRFSTCGCTLPAAPTLISPDPGATGIPLSPALDWTDVTGATSYDVQVATDANFVTVVASASSLSASTWTVSPALSPGATYYWRARAANTCGSSDWSAARSFTTCVTPSPTLVSPSDGAVLITTTQTLDWVDVAGAASYDVQVASTPAFTTIVRSASGLTASSWTVTPSLSSGATYYWRARATGACGTGGWSSARSFQVGCLATSAAYDAARRTPGCAAASCGCSSGTLLDSRDNILNKSELNQPNTINGTCADGTTGTYHSTSNGESVDRIFVKATDGLRLRPGGQAQIDVTVWCRGTPLPGPQGSSTQRKLVPDVYDYIDLYYTSNAGAPSWTPIATGIQCAYGGDSLFSRTFTLANVTGTHAVRAQIRYLGLASSCTTGSYNDHDDLTFRVEGPPQQPMPLEAGYGHSVSVNSDTSVWAWGWNGSGQLGDGTTTNRNGPVRSGTLTGVVAVAAGVFHTVALKSDGTVWTWGGNADGQLGDGSTVPYRTTPGQVPGLGNIVAIAVGANHTLALDGLGSVWAWGDNWGGQLGNGGTQDSRTPLLVGGVSNVTAIAAGFYHSVAVKGDGTVWTWGRNAEGELGDGGHADRYVPGAVPGLQGVRKAGCGAYFTLAVKDDGTIRAWGHNYYGELGNGNNAEQPTPVPIPDFGDVLAVAPGSGFSLVLRSPGTVWSFGQNVAGQLGDDTLTSRNTPVPVLGGLPTIAAIAGGEDHSLARASDGRIFGWGKNLYGQIGSGPWPQLTPIFITDQSALPPLALMNPTGGETWQSCGPQTVSWTGAGPVAVDMSVDAGATWSTLNSGTSQQDVPVTVPCWTTARALLRIRRVGTPSSTAQTASPMLIYAPRRYPWLAGTVDNAPQVTGEYASAALDPWGRTWIAYFDRTNGDLKVARRSGTGWAIETVDAAGTTGYFPSIAFASDGTPRISYMDGGRVMVRYASRIGGVWSSEDVRQSQCTLRTSLALDSADRPYIAVQDCNLTRVHVLTKAASWVELWSDSGASPTIRLFGDRPRVSYFLHSSNPTLLKYATATGPIGSFTWSTELVAGTDGADVNALALDSQGNPFISYYSTLTRSLRMAKKAAGSWSVQVVDASPGDVGNWNSIALDAAGRPRISYHVNGLSGFAEWDGTAWLLDVADASFETGSYSSLLIDGAGNARVAYFDARSGHLKYAISQPDVTAPAAVSVYGASGRTTAAVSWNESGDDGSSGAARTYEVRMSQQPLYDYNFHEGTLVPDQGFCASVQSLHSCSPYYFGVMAIDDVGNESPVTTIMVITDCSGSMEVTC